MASIMNRLSRKTLEDTLYEGDNKIEKPYPLMSGLFAIGNAWTDAITAKFAYEALNGVPEMESNLIVRPFLEQANSTGFLYAASAVTPLILAAGFLPIPKKIKHIGLSYAGLMFAYQSVSHILENLYARGYLTETLGHIHDLMYRYNPEPIGHLSRLIDKLF